MIGILSYGAYVPFHRLERKQIAQAFGDRLATGEKAVANFDEDSVSIGVSAALDCLAGFDENEVAALFFATTTAPYHEKQSSSTIATALDLKPITRTAELTGSLRASSSGFLSAIDAVASGAGRTLVVTSDCRLGAPQGTNEQLFGDGGAAFLFGQGDDVIARVRTSFSHTHELIGNWRSQEDDFVRSWEDRFVQNIYLQAVSTSVRGVLEKCALTPNDFAKIVIAGPVPRAQLTAAGKLGFTKQQVQDPLADSIGMTGTAHAPMMLGAALENAVPGDLILYVSFGEGSDAIVFEVTEAIQRFSARRGISGHLEPKNNALMYNNYLKWKGILPTEPARRPDIPRPSVTAMYRNYRQNLGLYGSKCLKCDTPQFPQQRVCANCQAKDSMEAYRFYGKTAKVATYTIDYLAASPAPPTVVAVIDFAGGGRMICEVTDSDPSELQIGMEVEMTFRRLYQAGGIHNYFWKAKPKRSNHITFVEQGK